MTIYSKQLHYAPLPQGNPAATASALLEQKGIRNTESFPPLQSKKQSQSFWARLMMMGAVVLPFSAAANAQGPAPAAPPAQVATSAKADDIDEVQHPFVNTASDLPQINRQMKQLFVDLARNPLLSPSARQDVEQMLNAFNSTPGGQMALVVIPDTHRKELNTLATELFNQMGIGEEGKNDGILLLLNAAAIREGRPTNRMQLMGGAGIDSKLTEEKAMELLQQFALPHLKDKNYDEAVRSTVKGVAEFIKPDGSLTSQSSGLSTGQKVAIGGLAIMALLLALAVTADLTVGRRGQFDMTYLYFNIMVEILRLALIIGTAGKAGGGSSGRGGGIGGGRGGGL